MATLVYNSGYKILSVQVSMTSQVQWWYMLWEDGSLWLLWFYSVHVMVATKKMAVSVRILLRPFRSWL